MNKISIKKIKDELYYISLGVVDFQINKEEIIFLSNLLQDEIKSDISEKIKPYANPRFINSRPMAEAEDEFVGLDGKRVGK